jgi:ankyrin repeat protein
MTSTGSFKLRRLLLCLALGAIHPPFGGSKAQGVALARTSRDAPVAARGKLGQELFLAITHRDLAAVQSLLARGADPNARNALEMTPLLIAAAVGQVPVVQALLRAGAKLDEPTIYGTPLTFAASSGNTPVARLLLARGAGVNPARPDGTTVLMYAARNGDREIIQALLRRKVDVNAKDNDGATALIYAARDGQLETGRLLLASGASVDARDSHGWTALMHAAVDGHAEFVRLLLASGASVNAREETGRTPLLLAAGCGDHADVLRALAEAGADLRAADRKSRTALALATARGYPESAVFLREGGGASAPTVGSSALPTPKVAVQTSLAALQRSMRVFTERTGCVSCHQEGLGRLATGVARQRGWSIDLAVDRAQAARLSAYLGELLPVHRRALQNPAAMKDVPIIELGDVPVYYGYLLAGALAHQQPATASLAAAAMVLARQQFPDGHWFCGPRGPLQSSDFTMTALAVQAMQTYAPKERAAEVAGRLRRARAWLLTAAAKTSEDKAFRLLGLKWAGASMGERRKAIEELRADQRPDGGWPQPHPGGTRPQSDAYGTGQALYALHIAGGLPVSDPLYQRGVQFLLRTQDEDGSWFVPKRVEPRNNYFDASFPHGEAQYASFNATCWATMALLQTIEPPRLGAKQAAR